MCMNRPIYEKVSMPFVPLQFQKTNVILTEKPLKTFASVSYLESIDPDTDSPLL